MQVAADKAVLIAGPTASGKSALALALARAHGGVVINADSMQVYRDLRILTARPSAEEEAMAPHRLYGHRDAAETFSVGAWLSDAAAALAEARAKGWMPIFVGGTGLYFRTLTRGLSAIPPISEDIREAVRAQLAREGSEAVHAELARLDPMGAERLAPRDRTRVSRALEVIRATGRPIAEWHAAAPPPLVPPAAAVAIFLSPERQDLYRRIDERFEAMIEAGALEEVRALAARALDPFLPAMKAHGVPWIIRHLRGEITSSEAIAGGQADTRHYAKRQFTWFRHQLPDFASVEPKAAQALIDSRIEGDEEISSRRAISEADIP